MKSFAELTKMMVHVPISPSSPFVGGERAEEEVWPASVAPRRKAFARAHQVVEVRGKFARWRPPELLIHARPRLHPPWPTNWQMQRDNLDELLTPPRDRGRRR